MVEEGASSRTVERSEDAEVTAIPTLQKSLEESVTLLRSPNDAGSSSSLRPEMYQAEVVQPADENTTTEKPPEGAEAGADATGAEAQTPTEIPAVEQEGAAAADAPTADTPSGETPPLPVVGRAVEQTGSSKPTTTETTTTTETPIETTAPEPKDPYLIDIPLKKKINKRTQRKLWEEIEKRKPLIPRHVAEHIQKYAKPPFETWGCKYRRRGSCFGCR